MVSHRRVQVPYGRRYGFCVSVVAAAVCPHPPLLSPQVAQGAAAELDTLRAAADAAVEALLAAGADAFIVVGTGDLTVRFTADSGGSFAPWGLAPQEGSRPPGRPALPLSLTVGRWLVERAGPARVTGYQSVVGDAPTSACVTLGAEVAGIADRVALLVMGDGSARRGADAPGGPDPRAEPFDAAVAAALAAGDPGGLLALRPDLAGELLAAGRAAWQVLAGAVGTGTVRAELRYAAAPYGVGYFVASWDVDPGTKP